MRLLQNNLQTLVLTCLLLCGQKIFSAEENIITVPSSGPITLKALDTYLKTVSTAPTFKIEKSCWYGRPYSAKLTDIVQQSLQQHANQGLLAFPTNMNQYFGKDPKPGIPKKLHINFTMNDIAYTITIPENNAFSPTSKYLYKIPAGTVNPLLSNQQKPEAPEDLTAYLAQFNTKEEIEAEIKRLIDIGNHTSFVLEEQIKFDEKLKALRDKLATFVQSQPNPNPSWPPAGNITYTQLRTILEMNNNKSFKINRAAYHSKNVTEKFQTSADLGILYMPQNLNAAFGDPAPGNPKLLAISFTMNQQEYTLALNENWFTSSSTPEWLKTPNQYITFEQTIQQQEPKPDPGLISIETLTAESFKQVIIDNSCQSFIINKAWYGTSSRNIDITEQMQTYAKKGMFLLPKNMNTYFQKDPAPGISKILFVDFTMKEKQYMISIPENNHDNFWIDPESGFDPARGPYIKNFMYNGIAFQAGTGGW
jgi:hypothetical protein